MSIPVPLRAAVVAAAVAIALTVLVSPAAATTFSTPGSAHPPGLPTATIIAEHDLWAPLRDRPVVGYQPAFIPAVPRVHAYEALPTATGPDVTRLTEALEAIRFPIPADSGEGKRIVHSNSKQRVWLVEANGSLLDTYLVSGRRGIPYAGTYRVYSKSEKAWAGHDGITMDFMVRFTRSPFSGLGIGFHSIPKYADGTPMQTPEELGLYRSGGCVRQPLDLAIRLYEWAPIGTTVVVLP